MIVLVLRIVMTVGVHVPAKRFGVARSTIQRRLRKGWVPQVQRVPRKAADAPPSAPPAATVSAPPVAAPDAPSGHAVTAATLVAALSLATCSAAFSISGLTAIFAGATVAVVGLGIAFRDRQAERRSLARTA
jgi:membrane-associated phospholipid phosphatase